MSKSAEAFRTISEVAEELGVPKHVLRFWELRFPQIKPMKRGGGRRYYRPADVELLKGIRHLLHAEGFTIKGVQKILRERGVDAVKLTTQTSGSSAAITARNLPTSASRPPKRARKTPAPPAPQAPPEPLTPGQRRVVEQVLSELKTVRDELAGARGAETPMRAPRKAVKRRAGG